MKPTPSISNCPLLTFDDTEDFEIPNGPTVRVYRPTIGEPNAPLPLILFAHGGGWFAGNLDTEDRSCRIVCSKARAWVVSVDYRCNFDVPLSRMVDDLHAAFEWTRGRAEAHGSDPDKIVLWGGSAGGSLMVALASRLVQEGRGSQVAGLVCMNGVALHPDATPDEYKHLNTSFQENDGPLPFVNGRDALGEFEHRGLVPPNTDVSLFPAAGGAAAVKGFPPTYLITSGNDAMRDDGTVLEACLKDAGVRVKRENVSGLAHYFWVFDLPKANEKFWASLVGRIKWTLES